MKKLVYLLVLIMLVSGCASIGNLDLLRTENRQNLAKLSIGMSKQEVLAIMGDKTATNSAPGGYRLTATNPYKSEILQGKDKTFEVLYYYTDVKQVKDPILGCEETIQDDELTPIIFDNGKLVGWGQGFLKDNVQKYEIKFR
jgi:hypothetical protein